MQLRDFPGTLRAKFCSDERSEVTVAYQSLSARSEPLKVSVEQSPRSSVNISSAWQCYGETLSHCDTLALWHLYLFCVISASLSQLCELSGCTDWLQLSWGWCWCAGKVTHHFPPHHCNHPPETPQLRVEHSPASRVFRRDTQSDDSTFMQITKLK